MVGLSFVVIPISVVCVPAARSVCLRAGVDVEIANEVEVVVLATLVVSSSSPLGLAAAVARRCRPLETLVVAV